MKRNSSFIFAGLTFAAISVAVSSCSNDTRFTGSWVEAAPVAVSSTAPGTPGLTSQLTIDFTENPSNDGGDVQFSCALSGVRMVAADSTADASVANVQLAATARVSGSWTYSVDDPDDILISFNMSTLKVDTSSNPALAADAAAVWQSEATQVFTSSLSQYTVIEGLEVTKDGKSLTFETENPDRDHHFRRADL